jgi:hypothetical protein
MFDHLCASLWWTGHRGGIASAVCAMAQPWTTVERAVRPAPPNDSTTCSRGRSGAEPTARKSGMAATTPPMGKAQKRVAHGSRSTEVRGMPGGEARAARGRAGGGSDPKRWGLSSGDTVSSAVQTRRARARCRAGLPPPLSRVLHGSAPSGGAQRRPPRAAERPASLWQPRGERCALL